MHNRKLSKRYSQFSGELTPSPNRQRVGTNKSSIRRDYNKNADLDLVNNNNQMNQKRGQTSHLSNLVHNNKERFLGAKGSIGINMEVSRVSKIKFPKNYHV